MRWLDVITADWRANRGNWKGRLVVILYRIANGVSQLPIVGKIILLPYVAFYKIFSEVVLGIEIHWKCSIGPGLVVYHGYGLVVHSDAVLGSGVILRHGVTIGEGHTGQQDVPIIGDNVEFGCNATVLGRTVVGNNAKIGAGVVVFNKNIPEGASVLGPKPSVI